MNEKLRNKGAQGSPENAYKGCLSGVDRAFVRRTKQVLRESRREIDAIGVLLPRTSSMSIENVDRMVEFLAAELTDYVLAAGYMVSRILEYDVKGLQYRHTLSSYIHSFDWEGIVQPLNSLEFALSRSPSHMLNHIYYLTHFISPLSRFCLKLSIRAEILNQRKGPLSWSETNLIRNEAVRLMNLTSGNYAGPVSKG